MAALRIAGSQVLDPGNPDRFVHISAGGDSENVGHLGHLGRLGHFLITQTRRNYTRWPSPSCGSVEDVSNACERLSGRAVESDVGRVTGDGPGQVELDDRGSLS